MRPWLYAAAVAVAAYGGHSMNSRLSPPLPGEHRTTLEGDSLKHAQALAPRLAAAAGQIDRQRRVPQAILDEMIAAGLFRMLVPRSLGGLEADLIAFLRVIETIAAAEAGTAWNLCQNAVCGTTAAYLPLQAARTVFGDPGAILAWGPPTGAPPQAQVVEGGYRVTGQWAFASGGRHATWLGGICPLLDQAGKPLQGTRGQALWRTMLMPAAQVTFSDVWDVLGLRGTASDSFSANQLFVPIDLTVVRDAQDERREPGRLYAFSTLSLFALGFACVALGIARSLLDAFMRLAQEKTPRAMSSTLAGDAETQSDVAQAEARLRAARHFLFETVERAWAAAMPGGTLNLEQRIDIRMAASHAIQSAKQVADLAYESAGSTGIFAANAFEKRFRDMHTVTQQLQGRKAHFRSVGKYLLGIEPDTNFL